MGTTQNEILQALKSEVSKFPKLPGVYVMKDDAGNVIYVGKAKDLKNRVSNYFGSGDGRSQIEFLLRRVSSIENIVTASEEQAFILERDLVTKFKPRYNIRLKDDKAYLCIRIDENRKWPKLELVRRVDQDGAKYFGPYSFSYEVRELVDMIQRVVPLRTCSDTVLFNRQRPCLEYQIKRCSGPCCLPVSEEQYAEWVKQAVAILEGKTDPLEKQFAKLMDAASEELRFEDAAAYRDRIDIIKSFKKGQRYISSSGEDQDVFALYREEKLATLSILKVRHGRVADNRNYSFTNVEISDEEVLQSSLEQYYDGGNEVPDEVIVPFELEDMDFIAQLLRDRRGASVELSIPQRGIKSRLLGLAALNAKQHYIATFDAQSRFTEVSKKLARLASLGQVPRRIECVDISNFQGSDIVGAVVSFFDGVPDKSSYKRYKISFEGKPDDFAAIAEVVSRRLRRAKEEDDFPDLLMIDGGIGQLRAALAARDELEVQVEIISLAKERSARGSTHDARPERIFTHHRNESIALDADSDLTHFLARIRDEVHRFVIGFHRARRKKRVMMSVLDEISGVGPERKRRLLSCFGSAANLKHVSPEEIARVGRMPLPLAKKISESLK